MAYIWLDRVWYSYLVYINILSALPVETESYKY